MVLLISGCTEPAENGPKTPPSGRRIQVFTTPGGLPDFKNGELGDINTQYCLLFDRITDSSEVLMAMHEFTMEGVMYRLLHNLREHPGARAEVIFDPGRYRLDVPAHRQKVLDSLHAVTQNPGNLIIWNDSFPHAGLFNSQNPAERKLMHAKFILLTHLSPGDLDTASSALLLSSANLSYAEAGESNEMVWFSQAPDLLHAFRNYFQEMKSGEASFSGRKLTFPEGKCWFYPFPNGADPLWEELANWEANEQLIGEARIRVALSHWGKERTDLAEELVRLNEMENVGIEIVLRADTTDIAPEIVKILSQLPAEAVRMLGPSSPDANYAIHSKLLLFEYLDSSGMQYRAYTGSYNWTEDALRNNSEILMRLNGVDTYVPLFGHWKQIWELATPVSSEDQP